MFYSAFMVLSTILSRWSFKQHWLVLAHWTAESLPASVQCFFFGALLVFATGGRHCACNMSCVGRLRSGCCVPLAEFALEEGAASHRSHRPGAKCSSPVRSLPHHLKRPQCPSISPPRSDEPHLSARHPGPLLLDCCAHCLESSALREANGEGPRITEGAGLCYCRRPAGSSLPGGLPVCQRLCCRIHYFHSLKSPCMDTSWLRLYAGYSS